MAAIAASARIPPKDPTLYSREVELGVSETEGEELGCDEVMVCLYLVELWSFLPIHIGEKEHGRPCKNKVKGPDNPEPVRDPVK